jgi:hypothetical protein
MKGDSQGPETAFLQYIHMFRNKKWAFSGWDELITRVSPLQAEIEAST